MPAGPDCGACSSAVFAATLAIRPVHACFLLDDVGTQVNPIVNSLVGVEFERKKREFFAEVPAWPGASYLPL